MESLQRAYEAITGKTEAVRIVGSPTSGDPIKEYVRIDDKHRYLMEVAKVTAALSKCSRRQVGCVLSDLSGQMFVVGYNGGPQGGLNHCRRNKPKRCGCVHAEMNAVAKAPRGPKIAYVTCSPCEMCSTLLINAGVRKVYYHEEYLDSLGQKVFDEVGIPYYQI